MFVDNKILRIANEDETVSKRSVVVGDHFPGQ